MLYTRKGDSGTTKTFGCDQRISKSSSIAEALGTLDEINSYLGICKVKSEKEKLNLLDECLKHDKTRYGKCVFKHDNDVCDHQGIK